MPTSNPQLELIKLAGPYSERFGHGVPMDVAQHTPAAQLIPRLKAALAAGEPISGWSEMPEFDIQARPATTDDEGMDDPEALKKHNVQSGRGPRLH